MNSRQILLSGLFLGLSTALGSGLVVLTEAQTNEQITQNEQRALLRNLYALLPEQQLDNDIVQDTRQIPAAELLGTEQETTVYRARLGREPVAVILNSIAPNGYSGKIHLLIGIYHDGRLAGVRALKHRETPGLGDGIEVVKSDWILGFNNKSLTQPRHSAWAVQRDGGEFEQFTGATITPRAVVQAVHSALLYYAQNAQSLFE